uniref:tumor necrosis factor receptor superfamily member 1B n=1 Tax=Semicossyphus pulcher TaxID=241346 RepID=UPI0037E8C473
MKDILVLLVLLNVQISKVCTQGYPPDSDGKCRDQAGEYLSEESNLCCKKCPPGERLNRDCSKTAERQCVPCPAGQYLEGINYSPNCRTCNRCKAYKGLQYAQNCSSTTRSECVCQPGMYCIIGFDDPYCTECGKYRQCKAGYGVSAPGTAYSNVRCLPCPVGTFSDTVSQTDPCWPHTNCHRRAVVANGSATSDTVCGPIIYPTVPQTSPKESVFTTTRTTMSAITATSDTAAPLGSTESTPSITLAVSETEIKHSTKHTPSSTVSGGVLAAAIASVAGVILLVFVILLACLCKRRKKKDAARFYPKVDANGNCEAHDKINEGYLGETQLTSFTVTAPEQRCLLEKGEACSDQSQSSNNTESLTRTDGCSSEESFGSLQPTALNDPHSNLSEPLPLLSHTEPDTPHTSFQTQLSSQPTSPQIISPVTPSPQVNVNITFNIGNGSTGTPSVIPADLLQADSKLPFGEEEESFSIPQQEAGKQSVMSVQESESCAA